MNREMKEMELRTLAKCCLCRKKIGELQLPIFHKVTMERHVLDVQAVQRQQGLTMMLGGAAALALPMGPDDDMTNTMGDPVTAMICDSCMLEEIPLLFMEYEK